MRNICTLVISIFIVSCDTKLTTYPKKRVDLSQYKLAKIKDHLYVINYTIYPSNYGCKNDKYATLYECVVEKENEKKYDTIYLFDLCNNTVPTFLRYKENPERGYVMILKEDLVSYRDSSINVFIPTNKFMPKGAKYLFGKLTNVTE
ncbi:hypothetical protein BKI52_31400 [marine bacterium AO1-C]|nr:hypothetical protein BKI52_31400 [marine bacterium AO1-C]